MTRLMSLFTTAINAMKNAVTPPITSTTDSAVSDSSNSGDMRATMKMPAVTMVAAWIRADIGVGPSMESGSHTCSGNCADLPMAPMNRPIQITESSIQGLPGMTSMVACACDGPCATTAAGASGPEKGGVVEGEEIGEDERDAEQEPEVAHAVDQKRLQIRVYRGGPLEPEPDQQVRHQAHRLPAEEQLQEVVGHHQHQHGEREQRDIGEKTLVARIVGHVADGVDVHHERDETHHHHHQRGEAVDEKPDFEPRSARREPGVDRTVEKVAVQYVGEDHARDEKRYRHPDDGDPMAARAADLRAEQSRYDGACQRRERHEEIQLLHGRHVFWWNLSLEAVQIVHVDRLQVAEQHHQDCQTDGGFR